MRSFIVVCVIGVNALSLGCGQSGSSAAPAVQPVPVGGFSDLKKQLEEIASSGNKGESFQMLQQQIDQSVRGSKPELADDLNKDFQDLTKASSAGDIKTIATRMAGKL